MYIQILGLVAGGLIAFASLPQFLKIIKTKDTKSISLQMYILLNIGGVLWIIYGILINQPAVIITNGIFQAFNLTILYLKLRHG